MMTPRRLIVLSAFVLVSATLSAFQAKPVDVTGVWTGTLTRGDGNQGTAHIDLKQKGTELTGTAGPRAEQQLPIAHGKIATVKGVTGVTFDVTQPNGGVMKFDLKVVEGRLKGGVTLESNGQTQNGTIDVGRAK